MINILSGLCLCVVCFFNVCVFVLCCGVVVSLFRVFVSPLLFCPPPLEFSRLFYGVLLVRCHTKKTHIDENNQVCKWCCVCVHIFFQPNSLIFFISFHKIRFRSYWRPLRENWGSRKMDLEVEITWCGFGVVIVLEIGSNCRRWWTAFEFWYEGGPGDNFRQLIVLIYIYGHVVMTFFWKNIQWWSKNHPFYAEKLMIFRKIHVFGSYKLSLTYSWSNLNLIIIPLFLVDIYKYS